MPELYLLRVKKGIYFSLIRLRNRSAEMEQRDVMVLNSFYYICAVGIKEELCSFNVSAPNYLNLYV